jgi:hypothetical protein
MAQHCGHDHRGNENPQEVAHPKFRRVHAHSKAPVWPPIKGFDERHGLAHFREGWSVFQRRGRRFA